MAKYTHCFDFCVSIDFESDIKDFDEAYEAWIARRPNSAIARAVLHNDASPDPSLERGIVHNWTVPNDTPEGS